MQEKKPLKRNGAESLHTTKLRAKNSKDYVPAVNGVDPDTLWRIMVTVSRVDIAV